jgi:ribosomal protein S18 acetylase RimI-like enzyme
MSDVSVREVTQISEEIFSAVNRLIPILSSSALPLTFDETRSIVENEAVTLLVAEVDGEIVGMLTLVVFPIPTGIRAWIEDVVVDESQRGKGVGEQLTRSAIEIAERLGSRTVDLTSRPSREAANRLYTRVGFQPRETNVYRYSSDD